MACGGIWTCGQVGGRESHGDVVPSQTQVHREAAKGPGVLRENPDLVVLAFLLIERHRKVVESNRAAAVEGPVDAVRVIGAARLVVESLLVGDTHLEVVAAGDVRDREPLGRAARPGNWRRQELRRAISVVGREFEDRSVITRDAGLGEVHPVGGLPREPGFEQKAVRERRRPGALHDAGRPPVPAPFRLDRIGAGERAGRAATRLLNIAEPADAVPFGDLPGHPQGVRPIPVEAGGWPTGVVGSVGVRRSGLARIEERARR